MFTKEEKDEITKQATSLMKGKIAEHAFNRIFSDPKTLEQLEIYIAALSEEVAEDVKKLVPAR